LLARHHRRRREPQPGLAGRPRPRFPATAPWWPRGQHVDGACLLAAAGTLHADLTAATHAMLLPPARPIEPDRATRGALAGRHGRWSEVLRGWITWPRSAPLTGLIAAVVAITSAHGR